MDIASMQVVGQSIAETGVILMAIRPEQPERLPIQC